MKKNFKQLYTEIRDKMEFEKYEKELFDHIIKNGKLKNGWFIEPDHHTQSILVSKKGMPYSFGATPWWDGSKGLPIDKTYFDGDS